MQTLSINLKVIAQKIAQEELMLHDLHEESPIDGEAAERIATLKTRVADQISDRAKQLYYAAMGTHSEFEPLLAYIDRLVVDMLCERQRKVRARVRNREYQQAYRAQVRDRYINA